MNTTTVVNVHKEPCDVSIMRPGLFQNDYHIGRDGDRQEVIEKHRIDFLKRIRHDDYYLKELLKLRGKKLGCCCKPKACHGDTYVSFLNAKVIGIVGSRRRHTKADFRLVEKKFLSIYEEGNIIVSGGCPKGGDLFAEIIADYYKIPIMIFRANWALGKHAGFLRNTDIARESHKLIACVAPDRTGGTEDTVKKFFGEPEYTLFLC